MLKSSFLSGADFAREFERCCKQYESLRIAVAWCGDPKPILPYAYLNNIKGIITATVGYSGNITHPDAVRYLQEKKADLRMFRRDLAFFHPKVYFFSSKKSRAVFLGSSNFTYRGFFQNTEMNVLLEGLPNASENLHLNSLIQQMKKWHTEEFSFKPTATWLAKYQVDYKKTRRAEKDAQIDSEALKEEEISSTNWLKNVDWETYYSKVEDGLERIDRSRQGYKNVLDTVNNELALPWNANYFDEIEKRRIIGGIGEYGYLGHVAASGRFMHLLKEGNLADKKIIVRTINDISKMNSPINWTLLEKKLIRLTELGPSVKVWGRILCLIRPDLYGTISSPSVRKNLSKTLEISQATFTKPAGYISLHKLIHSAPWFNTSRPKRKNELEIWKRKVAYMDAIFYAG